MTYWRKRVGAAGAEAMLKETIAAGLALKAIKPSQLSRVNDLIKMISPETMQIVNEAVVRLGVKKEAEDGRAAPHDTSVAQTDISHPVGARLLNDSVRVLTRLLKHLRETAPVSISIAYRNHTRGALEPRPLLASSPPSLRGSCPSASGASATPAQTTPPTYGGGACGNPRSVHDRGADRPPARERGPSDRSTVRSCASWARPRDRLRSPNRPSSADRRAAGLLWTRRVFGRLGLRSSWSTISMMKNARSSGGSHWRRSGGNRSN